MKFSTPSRYVLKEWDKMMVAKFFPGEFEAPFINNMNTNSVRCGIVSAQSKINQAYDSDTGTMA